MPPLSFDPETLPVVGVDGHLLAVAATELRADAIRRRFRAPPVWSPETRAEVRMSSRPPVAAAVLIALVARSDDALFVLLTRRTDHLTDHPGQISFAGGRAEPEDADAAATALREAQEEIGLDPSFVDLFGVLPTYTTGTGFVVTPVVGLVRPGFHLHPEPGEVAEVFEVPLEFLMNPAHHHRHQVETAGTAREFLSMPWQSGSIVGPGGGHGAAGKRYFIWGATAAMLRNLYRFLAA